ncbi:MAG: OmpH family outer membrane protein [Rhodospirillaceae bacterium]|nr:OmpH family outer membrane protein [Rhodospirillaceae bacterium]MBT4428810.1 OmpH family outer membrane protein [Rhodospirillaceae bacterium]MBT5038746.1 OmpH family outer membrane protein [Rhodospirillaceae bacterium]MBT5780153.1 OmpH family outer membrane protein [Rhodospirillaceae bacterium]
MRIVRYFAVLSLLLFTALLPQSFVSLANAQDIKPAVIGIVEIQAIMREALAAKSIQGQIEARRTRYQGEISAEEGRLRELEQELAKQRSVLSPEAYAKRRRDFEGDVATVQRIVADRRRELDQAYAGGVRLLQVEISKIIGKIAEEKGITLVLPQAQTLYVDKELRISREVLKRLDERLPDLTLEFGLN